MIRAILALVACFIAFSVDARDVGQWENTDPGVRAWYGSLKQPDNPFVSCCGEADAYWCDDVSVQGQKVFCKITDDRDDGPLGRPHIPIGTPFEIPPHKYKYDRGNPTGHAILFVGAGGVYCFVNGGGV